MLDPDKESQKSSNKVPYESELQAVADPVKVPPTTLQWRDNLRVDDYKKQ